MARPNRMMGFSVAAAFAIAAAVMVWRRLPDGSTPVRQPAARPAVEPSAA